MADDKTVMVEDETSVVNVLNAIYYKFSNVSGIIVNNDKQKDYG